MKRAVITSMGIVSSLGLTADDIIHSIESNKITFKPIDSKIPQAHAPIENFTLRSVVGQNKNMRYLNRGAQLGVAAACLAAGGRALPVAENTVCDDDGSRKGIFVGCGPNFEFTDHSTPNTQHQALWILPHLPNTQSSVISQMLKFNGENLTITTACAASLQAIGEAYRRIALGIIDVACAGGGDSRLSPYGLQSYNDAHALWSGDNAHTQYAPFNVRRNGFIPGEGGAYFIIEELSHAKKHNSPIIAEICGYGSSLDASSMTAPDPSGQWAETAILHAIDESGLSPYDIDLVCAHGTGTMLNDQTESDVLERVFSNRTRITALKSWVGHLSAACGAVELGIALTCMHKNYIPRIRNLSTPCNPSLSFVTENMTADYSTIIINNCGFGGQNASLVVRKWIS